FAGAWIETKKQALPLCQLPRSLPSRERGSKHRYLSKFHTRPMSLPSRERGSQLSLWPVITVCLIFAPFAGAVIETSLDSAHAGSRHVAPFAGAWIETSQGSSGGTQSDVAPFPGAWIETRTAEARSGQ